MLCSRIGLALVAGAACASAAEAGARSAVMQRFVAAGNGTLKIRSTKNRFRFAGRFRNADGSYRLRALRQIQRVFGAPVRRPEAQVSLRLIEALSLLQQHNGGGWIIVSSGYRSPTYNRALRKKGRTVAKASLHQYGMAADLRIDGAQSRAVWQLARDRKLGGAGYYGSPWVHLDTGPVRSWTQSTANVRSGSSDHNQRIILVPQFDVYAPGEKMQLRFARMTQYPIGVRRLFTLQRRAADGSWSNVQRAAAEFRAVRGKGSRPKTCLRFFRLAELSGVRWTLPAKLPAGTYRLQISFCAPRSDAMPAGIGSFPFTVRQ